MTFSCPFYFSIIDDFNCEDNTIITAPIIIAFYIVKTHTKTLNNNLTHFAYVICFSKKSETVGLR